MASDEPVEVGIIGSQFEADIHAAAFQMGRWRSKWLCLRLRPRNAASTTPHVTSCTRLIAVSVMALTFPLTAFAEQTDVHPVSGWIKSGVIYEINPRTFSATGDFHGIEQRLDYLKDLGVTILYLMPIHPIGHGYGTFGSPYGVQDYYAINPSYGTKDDFKRLITEAHRRRLKIMMDMVANHTAWDSVLMQHPKFYKKDSQGNIIAPKRWPDVAQLDYSNPQLRAYMTEGLKYWVKELDVDGFRCDAAGLVPTDFWENVRVELAKIKPEIVMLAEANKPELLMKAFDLDYAWPFFGT